MLEFQDPAEDPQFLGEMRDLCVIGEKAFYLDLADRATSLIVHAGANSSDFELIMSREQHSLSLNFRSHVFRPDDARRLFVETVAFLAAQFAHANAEAEASVDPGYG